MPDVVAGYDEIGPKCVGHAQQGTVNLAHAIQDRWPGASLGVYNCLAGETRVITRDRGWVEIAKLVGTSAELLTRGGPDRQVSRWVAAPIKSYGVQPLLKVTVSRAGLPRDIFATAGHEWITEYRRSGTTGGGFGNVRRPTIDLRPGMLLPDCGPRSSVAYTDLSPVGVMHGLVLGDGTRSSGGGTQISLYGEKNRGLAHFFPADQWKREYHYPTHTEPHLLIRGLSSAWKMLPDIESESQSYLLGWLAGYFAADGTVTKGGGCRLFSVESHWLEAVREVALRLGIVTHPVRRERGAGRTNISDNARAMYSVGFDRHCLHEKFFLIPEHRARWKATKQRRQRARWSVISVEPTDREEEVFCAEVPDTHAFVIDEFILTGNCRNTRGKTSKSAHAEGRAYDHAWTDQSSGFQIANAIVDHNATLGVQVVIFWDRIWAWPHRAQGWRYYDGEDRHHGHLHIEQNWSGAHWLQYAAAAEAFRARTPPVPEEDPMLPRCVHWNGAIFLVGYDNEPFNILDPADNKTVVGTAVGPWRKTFPNPSRLGQVVGGGGCVTDHGNAYEVTNNQFLSVYQNRGAA